MFFKALKVIREVFIQSQDNILVKIWFGIAFFTYYFSKKILGINISFFPAMVLLLHNCKFKTRKNTIDFWMVVKSHEDKFTSYLTNQKEKGIFIDVGTHIGRYSILMAKKKLEVFSFEPLKTNFNQFKINASLNGIEKNIHFYNTGIGDKKRKTKIFYDKNKGGEASIVFNKSMLTEEINLDKLDNLLKFSSQKRIILKIDVEGFEYEVLKGARNFIKRNNPDIFIEIWDKNKKRDYTFFKKVGYSSKDGELWIKDR